MDSFSKIFKKSSDHNNWDKQIAFYTQSTEITADRKAKILEALNYLRVHLSNGFLKNTKNKHPLRFSIANKATHSMDWLIWLHETLKTYEQDEKNFKIIIDNLKSVEDAVKEGIPFLEVASALNKSGFKVSFEPTITGFSKKPDLKLINIENEEVIYIEVTTKLKSDSRDIVTANYLGLNRFMEGKGVYYSGKIHESIEEEEIEDVLTQINELIVLCKKGTKLKSLTLEKTKNKFELAIVNPSEMAELNEWMANKNLDNREIESANINFIDDVEKINKSKIHEEAKQIPKGELGFIYFKVDPLVLLTSNLQNILSIVKRKLLHYEHIVGVVLWASVGDAECVPFGFKFGSSFYNEFPIFEINKRMNLFILNEKSTKSISVSSMHKIFESLERY